MATKFARTNSNSNEKDEGLSKEEIEQFTATIMRLLKHREGGGEDFQHLYSDLQKVSREMKNQRHKSEKMDHCQQPNKTEDHHQQHFGHEADQTQNQQTDRKPRKDKKQYDREKKLHQSQLKANEKRNRAYTKENVKKKNFMDPLQENLPFQPKNSSSSETEHLNKSVHSVEDSTEKLIFFLEQAHAWFKKCGRFLMRMLFYGLCLVIMLGICAVKFLWHALIFLLNLILILLLWIIVKLVTLATMSKQRFKIVETAKTCMSVVADVLHLVTGINIKAIFHRSYEATPSTDESYSAVKLPETSEEAVAHLMSQDENQPYRTLCVSNGATDADVKINYRKLALLVHPDKCHHSESDEAFKVLDSAFKKISDPQKRLEMEQAEKQREFNERFCEDFQKMFEELVNTIGCTSCNGKHKRTLVKEKNFLVARYCSECHKHHAADDGDVWAECGMLGLGWTCFVCMDGEVFELTEWAKCQNLRGTLPVNSHRVHCRLGNKNGHKPSRSRHHTTENDTNGPKRKKSKKSRKAR